MSPINDSDDNNESNETLDKDGILDSLNEIVEDDHKKSDNKKSDNDDDDDIKLDLDTEDDDKSTDENDETDSKDDDESEEKEIDLKDEDELDYKDIPKRQEILKAYPDIFKKFPGVEKAIYREQQYAEVFPTISDAKAANERLTTLKNFEGELLSGSIEGVLASVKNTDGKAFGQITGNLLQTLQKVDEKAYFNTLNFVLKNALSSAYTTGKSNDDDQLQIAAQLLHRFIYGNTEVTLPAENNNRLNEPSAKELELQNREKSFLNQQLNVAVTDVTTRTDNVIKSAIDKHIDPNEIMTPYVRNNAVRDVMDLIKKEIMGDTRFVTIKDKLWESALKDNFSEASKLKIRNALLSKAKTVLPGIIKKVKADALKGLSSKNRSANESRDERPLSVGKTANPDKKSSSGSNDNVKKGKEVPRDMKTLDYLMSD